jgi:hypothetical protein
MSSAVSNTMRKLDALRRSVARKFHRENKDRESIAGVPSDSVAEETWITQ